MNPYMDHGFVCTACYKGPCKKEGDPTDPRRIRPRDGPCTKAPGETTHWLNDKTV